MADHAHATRHGDTVLTLVSASELNMQTLLELGLPQR
jgi:hypothetical protein